MIGYLYSSNSKMQGLSWTLSHSPVLGHLALLVICGTAPQSIILLISLKFFFPFPLWIPLPQPTTTVWVALISVSDHVLVRTDNLLGWTYLHSTFLYVNDSTITTQPISPLIFGLSNSITSQVFFSGYSLDTWLCFSQTRSSTLLHLCLYGLCLQSFLLVIFSSKNPSYKIRLPPSPVQETENQVLFLSFLSLRFIPSISFSLSICCQNWVFSGLDHSSNCLAGPGFWICSPVSLSRVAGQCLSEFTQILLGKVLFLC